MANLLTPPTVNTSERVLVEHIDNELRNAAIAQKHAYDNVRQLIYGTPENPKTGEQVMAAYGAFARLTTTGLTPDQLGLSARLIKTVLNQFSPGTIVDEVPEVTFEI